MDPQDASASPPRKGIRFEDLGESVQEFLRVMQAKGRDISLMDYVGVRDLTKVMEAQSLGVEPDAIWESLEVELLRQKAARENPALVQQQDERRRAEQERRQELRRARAEQREEEEARKRREEEEARRVEEEKKHVEAEARRQQLAQWREEEQRREQERAEREAAAQQEAQRQRREKEAHEEQERQEAERRRQMEKEQLWKLQQAREAEARQRRLEEAATARQVEEEKARTEEQRRELERAQREAEARERHGAARQRQMEEEQLLKLRQAREAEAKHLEEVQKQRAAEQLRWEEERKQQADAFLKRQAEEERRLQLLAEAHHAQQEERRRRHEEEEQQWQQQAQMRRLHAEQEMRQLEAARKREEESRQAELEHQARKEAIQRAQQARDAELVRLEEERRRLESPRLQEEAAQAAAIEKERAQQEADRRRREEAMRERERQVEEEDAELLQTSCLQLEDIMVHWSYLAPGGPQWEEFPAEVQQILEQALMESTERCVIPVLGETWGAFVLEMYAQTPRGERLPLRRTYSDEPTVASRPAERTGALMVWSSYNPLSCKWERFPLLVSRVLELKHRAGAPSVDVLILGKLHFSIVFREMRQVSEAGFFRQVQRTQQRPIWERFSEHTGSPMWEELPDPISRLLEDCFAAGEQKAEVVSEDANGLQQPYTLELNTMRAVSGSVVQGLRRKLEVADHRSYVDAAGNQPPTLLDGPSSAIGSPKPASRSAAFLEVYGVRPQEVQQVVQQRVPPVLRYPLAQGLTVVGREALSGSTNIVLQGANLSRQHCLIEVTPQGDIFVTDTNSTVGTALLTAAGAFVRLLPMQRQLVEPGTVLALAQTVVRVLLQPLSS